MLERSQRNQADQDRNGLSLVAGEESFERFGVVNRLRLSEARAGFDLRAQLRKLDVQVGGRGVRRAADGELRRGPDRVAREVRAGVQALRHSNQPEHVDLRHLFALRIVPDLQRIAAETQERLQAEPRGAQEIRLETEDVAVAGRDLDHRVQADLALDQGGHRDRRHPQPRHRIVRDVGGVGAVRLEEPGSLDRGREIDAARGLDLPGHDERVAVGEAAFQPGGLDHRRTDLQRRAFDPDRRPPGRRGSFLSGHGSRHRPDVLGRRTATAADHGRPGLDEGLRVSAQVVGRGEIHVAAVDDRRVTGVRHHRKRRRDRRGQPGKDVVGFLWPESAVHADDVGAGHRQGRESVVRALAERRPAVGEKRHPGEDRDLLGQVADCAHRLGRLEQAAESLEQNEVDLGLEENARLFLEDLTHLHHRQGPVRLDESAERPDRAGDEDHLTRRRLARQPNPFAVDLLERVRPLVRRQLHPVRVPRVRRDDPRARVAIVLVDVAHRFRVGHVQRRLGLVRRRAAGDEEGPHRSVGEQNVFGDRLAKVFLHETRKTVDLPARGCQIS